MQYKKTLFALALLLLTGKIFGQFAVTPDPQKQKVVITVGGKPFTEFVYTDTIEKPVLYPIYAPDGQTITRGFPWKPEPNDPTDHPHHVGLWFNYEKVNGLDFWNNSFAIAADKKKDYGWIRTEKILETSGGEQGKLVYLANWTNQAKEVLIKEKTTYLFSQISGAWVIDRITELTGEQNVSFPDAKDGLLGLRVAQELEMLVQDTKEYKDDQGNITRVSTTKNHGATGNYLTSTGREGDSAWGTTADWCMLYGKKGGDVISIVIIDNPQNPGYPTYWHARNYGLFAANPLGQKIFSNGKETLNFRLPKGKTITFRYRILIASGKEKLPVKTIDAMAVKF